VMSWVVVLEERELRHRFGPVYEEYSRRVPRFIPKFGKRKKAE
jgi:protein-S-isoprenylcysteine O-methyltransferase Ste14